MLAGDVSPAVLKHAQLHYGNRARIEQFDAQKIPVLDASVDVVLIFEALYYLPEPEAFFAEVARVLRPGGYLLIVTANKDLYDFNPSPYSHKYFGVVELENKLAALGYGCSFFGDTPLQSVSLRQRLLRPIKKFVVSAGLMPTTMVGKKLLKRIVFGTMQPMPAEITLDFARSLGIESPARISGDVPNTSHKVIFCAAKLGG